MEKIKQFTVLNIGNSIILIASFLRAAKQLKLRQIVGWILQEMKIHLWKLLVLPLNIP